MLNVLTEISSLQRQTTEHSSYRQPTKNSHRATNEARNNTHATAYHGTPSYTTEIQIKGCVGVLNAHLTQGIFNAIQKATRKPLVIDEVWGIIMHELV
ncbi:MAG: hypothetical protein ACLPT4_03235 [Verrucomicrobiia bacterium]